MFDVTIADLIGMGLAAVLGILYGLRLHELAEFTENIHKGFAKFIGFIVFAVDTTPVYLHPTPVVVNGQITDSGPLFSKPPGEMHALLESLLDLIRCGIVLGIFFALTASIVWLIKQAAPSRSG